MAGLIPGDVCVLIPAFNEAKTITALIRSVQKAGFKVILSDDGSTDGTRNAAEAIGVQVSTSGLNQGKGACIRRGIQEFLKTDLKALVLMDGDGQHDPSELGLFLDALSLKCADLVIGNRMASPQGMPWVRRLTNLILSSVLSFISGQKVPDSQCGYRALTREAAQKILIRSDRFEVESEIILDASRRGFRIASVPIRCVYADEASRIRPIKDTFRFFSFLFHYWSRGRS